jgi:hypothetical protein
MASERPSGLKDHFCILPWIHLAMLPDNTARLCCVANDCIREGDVPLSPQTHSLEEIWNSDHLRKVRRHLATGRGVAECAHCYQVERLGGESRRLQMNARWLAELGPLADALVEESRRNDYALVDRPLYYQLMPGNLCNLKCRMCFPLFSSQIEHDPVHSRWFAPEPALPTLDWTRGHVTLAPQPMERVQLAGFHDLETNRHGPFRWTNGEATLLVVLPRGVRPECLRLRLGRRARLLSRQSLRIFINGTLVHDGHVPYRRHELEVPTPPGTVEQELSIRLESGTFRTTRDTRTLGIVVQALELIHSGSAESAAEDKGRVPLEMIHPVSADPAARIASGPWYRDDAWVRDALLQNADRLRGLYFTGGEPMIEKQVEHILDHLIERQVAGNIVLEMNTNCTVLRDAMLAKLVQFKGVNIGFSIDAVGPIYEYIRYPSRWDKVRRNVERLMAMPAGSWRFTGGVVLQVYNVLHLVDLLAYFDTLGIAANIEFAEVPRFLAVDVLPARVRSIAAGRLRGYAAGPCSSAMRQVVLSTAKRLETIKDRSTPEALRTLMLFTNDLDASRRQSMRMVHGELLQLLQESGFHWTDERSAPTAA